MRDDFCAFILTHGRPDKVLTYRTLRRAGYTGKIFIVVDDEDKTRHQYMAEFGEQVVKGVSFLLRLTVTADDGSERLVSTARTTETTYRFTQLAPGNYRLTVRAVNAWGQQGDPASVSFRIPEAPDSPHHYQRWQSSGIFPDIRRKADR